MDLTVILQEASTGEFELVEDAPGMVGRMIDYFYTTDYQLGFDPADEGSNALVVHAEMFALVEKHDVRALQALAAEKYHSLLFDPTYYHGKIEDFLKSLPVVYTLTLSAHRALRDTSVLFWRLELERASWAGLPPAAGRRTNKNQRVYATGALIAALLEEIPEFASDLLDSYMRLPVLCHCQTCGPNQPGLASKLKCITCGRGNATSMARQ